LLDSLLQEIVRDPLLHLRIKKPISSKVGTKVAIEAAR